MTITFYHAQKNGILASIIEHIPHNQKKNSLWGILSKNIFRATDDLQTKVKK